MRKIFDFFVFSSLFIALCAVVMVLQTAWLFQLDLPDGVLGFVFSGTVTSYNFHWYLTPPETPKPSTKLSWNIRHRRVHFFLFILGVLGSIVFGWMLRGYWFWLGITAFITFLYSAPKISYPIFSNLKRIAVGKTIFLSLVWAHVTAFLPIIVSTRIPTLVELIFVCNRFFYIYAICILFDYRDVEEDRKAGIRSMITLLDEKGVDRLFWCALVIGWITTLLMLPYFSVAIVAVLLAPQIALAFLYYPSKKNFSDYLYYFVLDGLMMVSAPLLLLIKFAR